jgi:hypothetical protein
MFPKWEYRLRLVADRLLFALGFGMIIWAGDLPGQLRGILMKIGEVPDLPASICTDRALP